MVAASQGESREVGALKPFQKHLRHLALGQKYRVPTKPQFGKREKCTKTCGKPKGGIFLTPSRHLGSCLSQKRVI